jgi:hypothetical protein
VRLVRLPPRRLTGRARARWWAKVSEGSVGLGVAQGAADGRGERAAPVLGAQVEAAPPELPITRMDYGEIIHPALAQSPGRRTDHGTQMANTNRGNKTQKGDPSLPLDGRQ